MDYKEPALVGFVQAAIDYLNYSKANGEKADLGNLTAADLNFLKESLGLDFNNDAAAILKGHQAFRDIIYKRQNDRESFDNNNYSNNSNNDSIRNINISNNNIRENEIPKTPYNLFKEEPKNFYTENQASSKESAEAIDNLFSQIELNSKNKIERKEEEIKVEPRNETIAIARDSNNINTIKEKINRIKNITGKDLRITNSDDEDPIFEYVEKESDYYKLLRNISKSYTDLSMDFIKDVLAIKEELDNEYPVNVPLILLHRISFTNVEELRMFTEIMIEHKYLVNVDEEKGIVDIFKNIINTNGRILSVICDVANQAAHIHGTYEGYKVVKAE